jgi:uncharacterized cupredoxin-like copper-binding protein
MNRLLAIAAAALLALAVAAPAGAAPATTVKVTAKDYSFVLSSKSVRHGRVTFVIANRGQSLHDFKIAGHASRSIEPGKTTRLTVTLKAGRYPYSCTVDSHAELGMTGVLRVT